MTFLNTFKEALNIEQPMHPHFDRGTIFPRIYDKTESMLQFRSHVFRSVAGGISLLLVQERRTMLGGEHGMRKGREKNSTIPLFSSPGREERWGKDGWWWVRSA